jgi:hypothetical protein
LQGFGVHKGLDMKKAAGFEEREQVLVAHTASLVEQGQCKVVETQKAQRQGENTIASKDAVEEVQMHTCRMSRVIDSDHRTDPKEDHAAVRCGWVVVVVVQDEMMRQVLRRLVASLLFCWQSWI